MSQDTKESILAVVGAIIVTWAGMRFIPKRAFDADPVGVAYDTYAIHMKRAVKYGDPMVIYGYNPNKFKGAYKYGTWYPITKKGPGHE